MVPDGLTLQALLTGAGTLVGGFTNVVLLVGTISLAIFAVRVLIRYIRSVR